LCDLSAHTVLFPSAFAMALVQTCPGMGTMGTMGMAPMRSLSTNATNTILASLPKGMSLAFAKMRFSKFGEISDIHLIPGAGYAVSVSYFDVRAAALGMEALGGPQYCRPGPQTGDRVACLHGDVHINQEDVTGVSNVFDDEGGKSYKVEFFDFRIAERVRSTSDAETKESVEPPPGLEHLAPPPGLQQPKAKKPVRLHSGHPGGSSS